MIRRVLHWARQLFVLPIRIYQGTLSRITPATCRFKPTCSQYAVESIENRGIFMGGLYATWRIMRCHPFTDGGWDLPPAPKVAVRETEDFPEPALPDSGGAHTCGDDHEHPASAQDSEPRD